MSPQKDWCRFGVKQQELDDQLPNLVIVFEAFKHSHNLKVWLCFALQRQQSSHEAWENFFELATIFIQLLLCGAERYKYYLCVIGSLAICYGIPLWLVWAVVYVVIFAQTY